jgi:hypothetical protein
VIVIGAMNAAVKPLRLGSRLNRLAWSATWRWSESSHWSALRFVGSPNSGLRRANGSSIDGSVLKNSTPAAKSLMVRPVVGSSRMPPGTSTLMKTWSGPSSLRPRRIVKPAMPAMLNPPCRPR